MFRKYKLLLKHLQNAAVLSSQCAESLFQKYKSGLVGTVEAHAETFLHGRYAELQGRWDGQNFCGNFQIFRIFKSSYVH